MVVLTNRKLKMRIFTLSGLVLGLIVSLVLVIVAGWMYLFYGGADRDAMTQGILGTIVFVFSVMFWES